MSREKDLAKNAAILTFGRICTQFIGFLLLPLYTAILEPEVYGIADLFNSYIYLLIPFISLMIDQGLFRFLLECRDDRGRQKTLLTTVICIDLFEILVFTTIFVLVRDFIKSEYKYFLLINVAINIMLNTLMQFARGIGKTTVYAVSSFLSASIMVASNVVLLVVLKIGAWGLFISTVIGLTVSLIVLIIGLHTWRFFSLSSYSKKEAKELLHYSLPYIPNQLSWWIVGASDRTIIARFIGVAANGIYSVANKFSSIYITFYNIFNLSWTESVALHINEEDAENYLDKTINTLFALFFSACLGIIAFMPLLFPIFINLQYETAYAHIPILMLAVLCQVVVGLYSVVYVAQKRSKEIAKTSFLAAVINITVDIALIHFVGLYAASISTLTAYATMAVYRYFDIRKYLNIPLRKLGLYALVTVLVCISYYYNHLWSNILIAILVVFFAVTTNKSFLLTTLSSMVNKIKKIFIKLREIS